MSLSWPVSTPPCSSLDGRVRIVEFNVSDSEAMLNNIRSSGPMRIVPGTYKKLVIANEVVMSNTRMEIITNREFVLSAHGNVLINGLGLGMVVEQLLKKDRVEHITIIEKDQTVIDLVAPVFKNEERVTIIKACAFEYQPPKGVIYDFVWHDIWTYIHPNNLVEMTRLHRKYGKRSHWQGSWAKHLCQHIKKGGRI